jgi:hypothetical protein
MRTPILAAVAALGLVTLVGSASADVGYPYPVYPQPGAGIYQPVCPGGYFWSLQHYDKHMLFWPTGCVPNGH